MSPLTSDCNIEINNNNNNKNNHHNMVLATVSAAVSNVTATAAKAGSMEIANTSTADSCDRGIHAHNGSRCDSAPLVSRRIRKRAGNLMSYQTMLVIFTVLVCGLATANGLKCHMCGQYNEGVGSITPCLNYSDQYAHLYLKECSKKSEKYCVKYVSELSIVRDCATECVEKEIWETQTYCCNTDGCNGSTNLRISKKLLLWSLVYFMYKSLLVAFNLRH